MTSGKAVARQAILYSLALLALTLLPQAFVHARLAAIVAATVLVAASIAFLMNRSQRSARRLFMTSNVYLLVAMVVVLVWLTVNREALNPNVQPISFVLGGNPSR